MKLFPLGVEAVDDELDAAEDEGIEVYGLEEIIDKQVEMKYSN